MPLKQKLSLMLLFVCLILACLPMEQGAGQQLGQMLRITLTVYALARGLNAVISVAQGTEMSIEPMGVGLSLTPGEILDPLNDLIEQVSFVLLVASASLGVQNILLSLGDTGVFRLLLVLLVVVAITVCLMRGVSSNVKQGFIKLVIILTVLRLVVPAMVLVSHQLQDWLATERQQALYTLQSTRDEVDIINAQTSEDDSSWFDNFKKPFDIQARLDNVKHKAEQSVEAAVYLLAEFVLIMVLVPLLFLYLMIKLAATIRLQ